MAKKESNVSLTAPYRFVPLSEAIIPSPLSYNDLTSDVPIEGNLDAEINIEWVPETPFLIGHEKKAGGNKKSSLIEPMRLGKDGDFVIPGASLKGMIKSVMEIITYARLTQLNKHHVHGVRNFEDEYYKNSTKDENVNAGWLTIRDGKYYIEKVKWYKCKISDIVEKLTITEKEWIESDLLMKYQRIKMKDRYSRTVDFNIKVNFIPSENKLVTIYDGNSEGILVFSGGMAVAKDKKSSSENKFQKQYEYIFESIETEKIEIKQEIIDSFLRIHSKPSKNKLVPTGSWSELQPTWNQHEKIPIFYIGDLRKQDAKSFYFGLTRLFKIPHKYSVGEILLRSGKHDKWPSSTHPDIVEALFGFVYEDDEILPSSKLECNSHKGRISFGIAKCPYREKSISGEVGSVMLGPRSSFAPYYLNTAHINYSSKLSKLAGRKRYPPQYKDDELDNIQNEINKNLAGSIPAKVGKENTEIITRLRYLLPSEHIKFTGTIKLRNAHPVELGALLWTICFGNSSLNHVYRHNLGRGKAFGMGQIRVANISVKISFYTGEEVSGNAELIDKYIDIFNNHMNNQIEGWPDCFEIDEYLKTSDTVENSKKRIDGKFKYLSGYSDHSEIRKDKINFSDIDIENDEPYSLLEKFEEEY